MAEPLMPKYPVYIPSKGRFKNCLTARHLVEDGVPFRLVVEREERDEYASRFGEESVLVLPRSGGGLRFARNWIKDHSSQAGDDRRWQLDDNMRGFYRLYRGKRLYCNGGICLRMTENFVDRYENVAVAGLNYDCFAVGGVPKPFYLNCRVYSCSLILNAIPHRWRLLYNDDTDLCLQVLADGWCTVLMNAFLAGKMGTMKVKGGNTDDLYQGDGRLFMARSLERMWPGVVETKRRFHRPQHVVKNAWKRFDTPLKRRADVDFDALEAENGDARIELNAVKEIKSPAMRKLYEASRASHGHDTGSATDV